jgi:serine/threonine-protein kinase HipA
MPEELAVWLYGDHVATIERDRKGTRLTYTERSFERYALGTPLLTLSLPLTERRYPHGLVRSFLDGLLPEGEPRKAIARRVGVPDGDTFGLIRAIGRDCAGAVVIQPADDPPPPTATTTTAEPLTTDEIETLVRDLRSAPLGVGGRVRISLAGVQEKLVLTRMPDGRWGRPVDGTPSTHILKPEIAAYPFTVENEAFCMRVAKHLGLDVANVETTEIAGRKLIVVERYDRDVVLDGGVKRIHQEDFCQALGVGPDRKYQENGGPSLATMAGVLATVASQDSLIRLLAAVVVNALLGNGDAHAKNFSLLHDRSGALRPSPLYDLLCTLHYGDDRLAMYIDDVRRTDRVTRDRIATEATRWGMGRVLVMNTINELLARAGKAITTARDDTDALPDDVLVIVRKQLERLTAEQS